MTLVKSAQHLKPKQRGAARVLRLRRIGDQSILPGRPELIGAVRQIEHVVSVRPLDAPIPGVRLLSSGRPSPAPDTDQVSLSAKETTTGGDNDPPSNDRTTVRSLGTSEGSDDMSPDLKSTLRNLIQRLRPDLGDDEAEDRAQRSAAKSPRATSPGRGLTDEEAKALEDIRHRLGTAGR